MSKCWERRYCKFGGDTCNGLEDIARKREGGLEIAPPPVGRGVNFQWRRQGLMVGEAHLIGEAIIFDLKYIIHECGLPTNYL